MRKISLVFLLLLLCDMLYSQTDSSAESFYPSQIGNIWRYRYTPNIELQTMITRDSLANEERYIFLDDSNTPAYKIDSLFNVTTDPTQSGYSAFRYKLTAQKGETWISEDTTSERSLRTVARVEDIFWGMVLGITTQIKRIGYYKQSVSDTTDFSFWLNDTYLAAGFGYLYSIYDASQTPDVELIGCIIDGKKYGTVVSVHYDLKNAILSSYKLNSAYPNPFNPATTISYQLPERNFVNLRVFDALGREIVTIVDGEQQKGYYQIRFTPQNLSTGIYFVRMAAGNFSQTIKIIYAK